MKRTIFVAALALTPTLLHAQAKSPAQTSSPAVLQARIAPVADIKAAAGSNAANAATSATASTVRVSTGVVAPKLLKPIIFSATAANNLHLTNDVTVVLTLTVDETGKPGAIAVSESAGNNAIDQEVLTAIGQARFRPGTLDGQPFALPLRLRVVLERGTEY
jgi:TonB family protein